MRSIGKAARIAAGAAAVAGTMALGAALFSATPALAANPWTDGATLSSALRQATDSTAGAGAMSEANAAERAAARCSGYVDADGDGVCDACGNHAQRGHHGCDALVDDDGDGCCDRCRDETCDESGIRAGSAHHGHHHGSHHGTRHRAHCTL